MFKVRGDRFGLPYFSYVFNNSNLRNISDIGTKDINHFLSPTLDIRRRVSGPFSSDLTSRDDVFLAFLSLILLLIIDGLVSTVLLRTEDGNISNFGFSVKQIMEFIRDFNLRRIFKARTGGGAHRKIINSKLVILAVSILMFTLGLEMAVLILTAPKPKDVLNSTATFRLVQPLTPKWDAVFFHTRASMNRPCQAVTFKKVAQAQTRINVCVSANMSETELKLFEKVDGDVKAKIVTYMHDYGADHMVTVADQAAMYSTRAYFTLGDRRSRLMSIDTRSPNETEQVEIIHKLYIAYLFSVYQRATQDERVDVNVLNSLGPVFVATDGGLREVLALPDKNISYRFPSKKYTTTVSGLLPRGSPALRVAQHVFAGATAINVSQPHTEDLFMEDGMMSVPAVVWRESVRDINWLSLCLIVASSLLILMMLRQVMKPVATAEVAGVFVKAAVGATMSRSPVELEEGELVYFKVTKDRGGGTYTYGAETLDRWSMINNTEEY